MTIGSVWSIPRAAQVFTAVVLSFSLGSAVAADPDAGYSRWMAHRDALAKDPSVARYHDFEEKSGDTLHNLTDKTTTWNAVVAANPVYIENHPTRAFRDFPTWSQGRWPGKGALTFGAEPKSVSRTGFYDARDNHFTVETWVRLYREPGDKSSTEICYEDDTITSGWKLLSSNAFTLFQISRPPGKEPGQGAVAIYAPALSGHVWHHIVAQLDGNTLVLYLDGKQAGRKEFDGIYSQPKVSALAKKAPELDSGGLVLGNRTAISLPTNQSAVPNPQFDMDEFVLYQRVLTPEEVAANYAAGAPSASNAEQIAGHKEEIARRARQNAIGISIPTNTFGYFPIHEPFSATVSAPVESGLTGALKASFVLKDVQGAIIASQQRALTSPGNVAVPLTLPKCGLYTLDVDLSDASGSVRSRRFNLAGIVGLQTGIPAAKSPLGGHGVVQTHPADSVLGTRVDRTIAPFLRILPNGEYDWSIPDMCIDAMLKNGLEPLYTIYPPFNMPKNSPQELAKDPQRWANWVRDLTTHFKGKVRYWEIWNEPNAVPGFSATDYVTLLKTAYPVIKEVDPTATVLGGCGVYIIPQWTEAVLRAGAGPYMDVLSIHNYVGTSPIAYRNRYQKVRQTQDLLVKYLGHPIPVWNSEGGIHQPARIDGRPVTDEQMLQMYGTRANKQDGWPVANVDAILMTTEHRSACWNVQSILMDLADGDAKYITLMGAGTFYPFKSSTEGSPSEKGIAYAQLSSVVRGAKSIAWLPLSNSKAAAILVTGEDGRRTAVLFSDVPQEFTFGVPDNQSFNGADFLGNPLKWQEANGGLTLKTGDEPIYVFNVPPDFAERRLLSNTDFPKQLAPKQSFQGVLNVANPGRNPLAVTLSGGSIAGTVTMAGTATVPPRGTLPVLFRFEADANTRGNRTVSFVLKSAGKAISQLEIPFYAIGPAANIARQEQPMALDGQDAVWANLPAATVNQAGNVVIGKPDVGFANANTWQGPQDAAFTVKTAWRANDGIYLLIDVVDDQFHPTPPGNVQPWLWDGLELFVDTRPLGSRTAAVSPGAQQIMVIPGTSTTAAPCVVRNLAGASATVDAVFTSRTTPQGYQLIGKLAPKAGSNWELKPGLRLGLDFAIDDNDDGAKRKSQLVLHGTVSNAVDTSRWGEYELAAK